MSLFFIRIFFYSFHILKKVYYVVDISMISHIFLHQHCVSYFGNVLYVEMRAIPFFPTKLMNYLISPLAQKLFHLRKRL